MKAGSAIEAQVDFKLLGGMGPSIPSVASAGAISFASTSLKSIPSFVPKG
jgi:hypothetical protein